MTIVENVKENQHAARDKIDNETKQMYRCGENKVKINNESVFYSNAQLKVNKGKHQQRIIGKI